MEVREHKEILFKASLKHKVSSKNLLSTNAKLSVVSTLTTTHCSIRLYTELGLGCKETVFLCGDTPRVLCCCLKGVCEETCLPAEGSGRKLLLPLLIKNSNRIL